MLARVLKRREIEPFLRTSGKKDISALVVSIAVIHPRRPRYINSPFTYRNPPTFSRSPRYVLHYARVNTRYFFSFIIRVNKSMASIHIHGELFLREYFSSPRSNGRKKGGSGKRFGFFPNVSHLKPWTSVERHVRVVQAG